MQRNDGFLAATMRPRRSVPTSSDERRQQKVESRGKLMPAADVVFQEIDRQKHQALLDLKNLAISVDTTEENVKAHLVAVKMHLHFLDQFQNKMDNILRQPAAAKPEADDA